MAKNSFVAEVTFNCFKVFWFNGTIPFCMLSVSSFIALVTFPLWISRVNFLEILAAVDGVFDGFWIFSPSCSKSKISPDNHKTICRANAFKCSLDFDKWAQLIFLYWHDLRCWLNPRFVRKRLSDIVHWYDSCTVFWLSLTILSGVKFDILVLSSSNNQFDCECIFMCFRYLLKTVDFIVFISR